MSRLILADPLADFVCFAGLHLGQQYHSRIDVARGSNCTEIQKLAFVPQIFALIPRDALFRVDPTAPVKGLISTHLANIGVTPNELLVDIVKDLADNFFRTRFSEIEPKLRQRKASISDLRSQRDLYRRIRDRQGARCSCCGTTFLNGPKEETLDHVIPWRLGGDPPGGWNWQLLCRRCNSAKGTLLTSCATREYYNWIFDDVAAIRDVKDLRISEQGRYVALRSHRSCNHHNCKNSPNNAAMFVTLEGHSSLPVFDHVGVYCEEHASGRHILD